MRKAHNRLRIRQGGVPALKRSHWKLKKSLLPSGNLLACQLRYTYKRGQALQKSAEFSWTALKIMANVSDSFKRDGAFLKAVSHHRSDTNSSQ